MVVAAVLVLAVAGDADAAAVVADEDDAGAVW